MKQSISNQKPFMQQALGEQWDQLPQVLKAHYSDDESGENIAKGALTINYPKFMQIPLNVMRWVGALVNQKGDHLPTTVKRVLKDGEQYWHRSIHYPDGATIAFKSRFTYDANNKTFIEYTNRFFGLKMKVFVEGDTLRYESCGYVIKLGAIKIPLPEWLLLGHASIVECAISDSEFKLDFRLNHPVLGEIFSYTGDFKTL